MAVSGYVKIDATTKPPRYDGYFVVAATQAEAEEAMKRELDADFVLKAKERLIARASALGQDAQSQKVAERGRELLEAYHLRTRQ